MTVTVTCTAVYAFTGGGITVVTDASGAASTSDFALPPVHTDMYKYK